MSTLAKTTPRPLWSRVPWFDGTSIVTGAVTCGLSLTW
jgi:hypothetical protein